jgi:hypothetical protein
VRLAPSMMWRSQQTQYIIFYNTVVLVRMCLPIPNLFSFRVVPVITGNPETERRKLVIERQTAMCLLILPDTEDGVFTYTA